MRERSLTEPDSLSGWSQGWRDRGSSVLYLARGDDIVGGIAVEDEIRPEARATVDGIRAMGRQVMLITGDAHQVADAVGRDLGLDEVLAEVLPEDKDAKVAELQGRGLKVAMVGDGVNDAPAMAAATLGIAMGAIGTDVAIETADVVLMSDDISRVDYVIHLGKRARRVVRQNVIFSIGWMLLLVILAVTIGLPLPLAVVGHEGSTLLVAANGLRLLRGGPHAATPGGTRLERPDLRTGVEAANV